VGGHVEAGATERVEARDDADTARAVIAEQLAEVPAGEAGSGIDRCGESEVGGVEDLAAHRATDRTETEDGDP
jgi:hypothetical protein